jgi:hypothetical protein
MNRKDLVSSLVVIGSIALYLGLIVLAFLGRR